MKYIIVLLLFVMFCATALAQQVPHPAPMSLPKTNTELKAINGGINLRAARLGFTIPGDGGYAEYNWSAVNCPFADDGAQVQPGSIGCWIADFSNSLPVPEVWGAKGTGTDNDTVAVNAGLAYVGRIGNGRLYGRTGGIYGIADTITIKDGTSFTGAGWDNGRIILLNGSFSPAIKLEKRAVFENWFVDATPQNSGVVIQMGAIGDYRSLINRVFTLKGCLALDINGVSHTVRDSSFVDMNAVGGCGGVRVGHSTSTSNQTVELRLVDSLIQCDYTLPTRADYGLLLEDANGSFFSNLDNIGCIRGTIIKPNANQSVNLNFFNNSAMGDTNLQEGLLIDTGTSTAKVASNNFVNTWTSGAPAPTGTGIRIKNAGGGIIDATHFIGHRVMQNYTNGVQIDAPTSGTIVGTTFDMLRVCNTQVGANIVVAANLDFTLRDSRIGKACDGHTAGSTTLLTIGLGLGSNVQLIATGNDFSYTGGESWTAISGVPARNSVVANNTTDLSAGAAYTAASTITLTFTSPRIHLTAAGAATVDTITPAWNGQQLCVIGENAAGAITFSTAGNIRFPVTIPSGGGMVCGYYDSTFSKWVLK